MIMRKSHLAFLHDLLVALASVGLAFYLRVGDGAFVRYWPVIEYGTAIFGVIAGTCFLAFGMYRGVWRYASLPDLVCILKASTVAVLVFTLVLVMITRFEPIPRSVPIIQWLLLVFLLGGPRLAYRLFKDNRLRRVTARQRDQRVPVLLVGANDSAELFIRAAHGNRHAPYRVVAVLDERGRRQGREIHGVPICDGPAHLAEVVARLAQRGERPQRLVLTDPTPAGANMPVRRLVEMAETAGLAVSRLPSVTELRDAGEEDRLKLRPIALEDLLGRPQIALDLAAMRDLVGGRRVLVTGAGGTIGAELTRQIAGFGPAELVLVDNGEFNLYSIDLEVRETWPTLSCRPVLCDVRDRDRIVALCTGHRPELVFHAAALKHVPMVEGNPGEGVLTNAIGTRNVADAARAVGARAMVQISTDKAVNPTSVMGATKRLAEHYCQALDLAGLGAGGAPGAAPAGAGRAAAAAADGEATRFVVVRFGNVLGSSGSVVPLFQRQLARGGPLTVTHPDIRRYFMTVREAVGLVLHASAHAVAHPAERGRILVLDMGEPVRIADVARQLIRLSGLKPDEDVKIVFTGLRPGEKLYEELFDSSEVPMRTGADGVLAAAPPPIDLRVLQRAVDELAAAAGRSDSGPVLRLLGQFVPGYPCADDNPHGTARLLRRSNGYGRARGDGGRREVMEVGQTDGT